MPMINPSGAGAGTSAMRQTSQRHETDEEPLPDRDQQVVAPVADRRDPDLVEARATRLIRDLRERALTHPRSPRQEEEHEDAAHRVGRDAAGRLLRLLRGVLAEAVDRLGHPLFEAELARRLAEPLALLDLRGRLRRGVLEAIDLMVDVAQHSPRDEAEDSDEEDDGEADRDDATHPALQQLDERREKDRADAGRDEERQRVTGFGEHVPHRVREDDHQQERDDARERDGDTQRTRQVADAGGLAALVPRGGCHGLVQYRGWLPRSANPSPTSRASQARRPTARPSRSPKRLRRRSRHRSPSR